MSKVILVGGFHETIELVEACGMEIIGVIKGSPTDQKKCFGYEVLGSDEDAAAIGKKFNFPKLVLSPDLPSLRFKLFEYYGKFGFEFASVIHPTAFVSRLARLGSGILVQRGVNISAGCSVGDFSRLNTNANIMHDCLLGRFVTVSPNAVLLGHVTVRDFGYVGSNATVLPKKTLGESSLVGAGSVVTKDVEPRHTVAGNPARRLEKAH